jgi:hypothetical protein
MLTRFYQGVIDGAGCTLYDGIICFEFPVIGVSMLGVSKLSLVYINSTFIWI